MIKNIAHYKLPNFAVINFICKQQSHFRSLTNVSLICFSENIQKLSKLFLDRPLSALDTSSFWVEYIIKYGNVLQSPALNLYWWQNCLLDIYAFILVIVITMLSIALFILRKLKKLLFGSRTCAKKDNAAIKSKKNK